MITGGTLIESRLAGLLILVFLCTGAAPPHRQTGTPESAAAVRATPAQVSQWITQLDANQFVMRRTATENLVAAGLAAVAPLGRALRDSNLEVATRGVYVLRALAVCGDVTTEEAASACLEKLAAQKTTSASRLARESLAALGAIRQQRALDQLRDLGARIEVRQAIVQFQRVPAVWVTIGAAWRGTATDLQRLKWLRDVQQLTLDDPRVTDSWLAPVRYLSQLERLIIKHTNITDDGLQIAAQLKRLRALDIMYTPVTDAAVRHLRQISTLEVVRIYGTKITPTGIAQLRTALAKAEVDYKNGAFLGVRCQQPPWPCEVVQVTKKSAAEKAGVHVGDMIIRYAGAAIADFEDLRKQIANNKVADKVQIQVVRGSRPPLIELRPAANGPKQLGLQATNELYGCKVSKVEKASDAARAGIQPGDVIIEIDDMPVADLDTVRKAYASSDTTAVGVQIIRGAKILTYEVTFGEWTE